MAPLGCVASSGARGRASDDQGDLPPRLAESVEELAERTSTHLLVRLGQLAADRRRTVGAEAVDEVGKIDGILGAGTRSAVQKEQARLGLPADGWPTPELLGAL